MSKRSLDPAAIHTAWERLHRKPLGRQLFSRMIGMMAPYTGSIRGEVLDFAPGYAKVQIRDRRRLRNHLNCIHAVALINLGEMTTGLAMMGLVPSGGRGIVTNLSMEYVRKARGTIIGESRAVLPSGSGKLDATVEGTLRDAAGEVVAIARAQWRLDIP
ncbi:MAG: DUF4442 domain-containing protein [Myxococcales bacterium]|nr:DUF4442 domain-containing protein [Myxococcales bacterium]